MAKWTGRRFSFINMLSLLKCLFALNFAVPYRVNKHVIIALDVSYWFAGWDPTQDVGGATNFPGVSNTADPGSYRLVGIHFRFNF